MSCRRVALEKQLTFNQGLPHGLETYVWYKMMFGRTASIGIVWMHNQFALYEESRKKNFSPAITRNPLII